MVKKSFQRAKGDLGNSPLTRVPSGWTYDKTFVLYDRETSNLWYPYGKGLMSIQGKYSKRWLPKITSKDPT